MQLHLFLADKFVDQHGFLKAALEAIDGVSHDSHRLILSLGKRQHRGELFALTARRRFDQLIRLDHLEALAGAIIDEPLALGRDGMTLFLLFR